MTSFNKCDILLFILLALMSQLLFKGTLLINGGDLDFPLTPGFSLERYLSLWDDKLDGGSLCSRNIVQLPYQLSIYLLHRAGIPLQTIQRILAFLLFFIAGFSMYLLTRHLLPEPEGRTAALFAGALYMANPFHAVFTWSQLVLNIPLFCVMPLSLYFFIRLLREIRPGLIVGFLVSCVIMMPAFTNPVLIATAWTPAACWFIFHLLLHRNDSQAVRNAVKGAAVAAGVFVAVNAWWLIPLATVITHEYRAASQASVGYTNLDVLKLNSRDTGLFNIVRLLGHWPLHGNYRGDPYTKWGTLYDSGIFMAASCLVPAVVFCSVFFIRKTRHVLFFLTLSLLGLFLVKGDHSPLGWVNLWLYKHIPFFDSFRNQYEKFGIFVVLGYSFLFGYTVVRIRLFVLQHFSACPGKTTTVLYGTAAAVLFLFQYPFWTGSVVFDGGRHLQSYHSEIPGYYDEARTVIHQSGKKGRLLELPIAGLYGVNFLWEHGYQGVNPTWRILEKPSLFTLYRNPVIGAVDSAVKSGENPDISSLLSALNISNILVHGDADETFAGKTFKELKAFCDAQPGLACVGRKGPLYIYETKASTFLPKIYTSSSDPLIVTHTDLLPYLKKTGLSTNPPHYVIQRSSQEANLYREAKNMRHPFVMNPKVEDIPYPAACPAPAVFFTKNGVFNTPVQSAYAYECLVSLKPQTITTPDAGSKSLYNASLTAENSWLYKDYRCSHTKEVMDGVLVVRAVFDGAENKDEYIRMYYTGQLSVDLFSYPKISIYYTVDDPTVQTIELVAGIDLDGNGRTDKYITGIYMKPAPINWEKPFVYNLLAKARRLYPDNDCYQLTSLSIQPHKLWKTDCAGNKAGYYTFRIKDVRYNAPAGTEELCRKPLDSEKTPELRIREEDRILRVEFDPVDVTHYPKLVLKTHQTSAASTKALLDLTLLDESGVSMNTHIGTYQLGAVTVIDARKVLRILYPNSRKRVTGISLRPRTENNTLPSIDSIVFREKNLIRPQDYDYETPLFIMDGQAVNRRIQPDKDSPFKPFALQGTMEIKEGPHVFAMSSDKSAAIKYCLITPVVKDTPTRTAGPPVTFKRLNPCKYLIHIKEAKGPFYLIFSEGFNEKWRLFSETRIKPAPPDIQKGFSFNETSYLFKKGIPSLHYKVNGYANAWLIDPWALGLGQDFVLTAYFVPQGLVYIGALAAAGCLIFLGIVMLLWRKREN